MPVQPFPGGYDPNSGQPPDDSTGNVWGDDVDLPGQFGRGGFKGSPKLILGGNGPPPSTTGQSLTAQPMPAGGVPADAQGPQIFGPQNSTIPSGKQVGPFTNPATDATFAPGQPLPGYGGLTPNIMGLLGRYLPRLLGGPMVAATSATPAETGEFHPNVRFDPATSGPKTGIPVPRPSNALIDPYGPTRANALIDPYGNRAPVPNGPTGPSVTNRPQDRPSYAGPAVAPSAVAAQKPNLGFYQMDRPNLPAGQQGGRGGPSQTQMGVFGFNPQGPFLGMGANAPPLGPLAAAVNPAAAAPPAPAPVPMPIPRPVTNRPQDRPSYAGARINPGGAY